jgi:plasmid rolling circle replication initiator protein Rep
MRVSTLKFKKVCGRKFFELLKISTFKFEVCVKEVFQVIESFKFQVCQREFFANVKNFKFVQEIFSSV